VKSTTERVSEGQGAGGVGEKACDHRSARARSFRSVTEWRDSLARAGMTLAANVLARDTFNGAGSIPMGGAPAGTERGEAVSHAGVSLARGTLNGPGSIQRGGAPTRTERWEAVSHAGVSLARDTLNGPGSIPMGGP